MSEKINEAVNKINETLKNVIDKEPKQEKKNFLEKIRPDKNSIKINRTNIEWEVQVDPSDLLDIVKGLDEGDKYFDDTTLNVTVTQQMDDTTQLYLNINGKPLKLNTEGNITFGAIKKF